MGRTYLRINPYFVPECHTLSYLHKTRNMKKSQSKESVPVVSKSEREAPVSQTATINDQRPASTRVAQLQELANGNKVAQLQTEGVMQFHNRSGKETSGQGGRHQNAAVGEQKGKKRKKWSSVKEKRSGKGNDEEAYQREKAAIEQSNKSAKNKAKALDALNKRYGK